MNGSNNNNTVEMEDRHAFLLGVQNTDFLYHTCSLLVAELFVILILIVVVKTLFNIHIDYITLIYLLKGGVCVWMRTVLVL